MDLSSITLSSPRQPLKWLLHFWP